MHEIGKHIIGPWMIAGDFNEILGSHEKWGGKKFNPRKAKGAIEFMENAKKMDLGSIGPAFTGTNKRTGLVHVKE